MTTGADLARAWFESSPFVGQLGLRLLELGDDRADVELPFRDELATAGDVVHGGAISSLVDTAAALAAWSNHDPAQGAKWGTIGISIHFLAPARATTLVARARVTRRSRMMCFCSVEVDEASGATAIAEALVTYRLG